MSYPLPPNDPHPLRSCGTRWVGCVLDVCGLEGVRFVEIVGFGDRIRVLCAVNIVLFVGVADWNLDGYFCFSVTNYRYARQDNDIACLSKSTKTTTTNCLKFLHLYFSPKITTKNRTKWIFTNRRGGCIMIIPSKAEIRVSALLNIPAQLAVF